MIQANELRLGNLVNIEALDNSDYQVLGVTDKLIYYSPSNSGIIDKDFYSLLCYVKPIPLTEEWLVKFGFERDLKLEELDSRTTMLQYYYGDIHSNNFIRICFHPVGKYTTSFRGNPLTKPEYVHQLQNLYFALTGEELKIKL